MRILGGRYKGHALKLPRGIRSTSDKVRGAVFNVLADAIEGAQFLDICAGSGAVGLEALSRGAAVVTWIERDPACCRALRDNVGRICGPAAAAHAAILCHDAPHALQQLGRRGALFDLLFVDPPYDDIPLFKKTLQALACHVILRPAGWLVVEHGRAGNVLQLLGKFEVVREYRYGDTFLTLCRCPSAP